MNRLLAILLLATLSAPVQAHSGHALANAQAGFLHPFSGLDHVLVMLAIGLWAGRIGGSARWQLPLTFIGVMTIGVAMGMSGWLPPGVELGLAVSVLSMGLLLALQAPLQQQWQLVLTASFGLLHGLAHGTELMQQGGSLATVGMLAATALLHGMGLLLSQGRLPRANDIQRGAGSVMALFGAYLLLA